MLLGFVGLQGGGGGGEVGARVTTDELATGHHHLPGVPILGAQIVHLYCTHTQCSSSPQVAISGN